MKIVCLGDSITWGFPLALRTHGSHVAERIAGRDY